MNVREVRGLRSARRAVATCGVALLATAAPGGAQDRAATGRTGGRSEVFAGGELENYLRYLQSLGEVTPYPWSIRAFSPPELDVVLPAGTAHPWSGRYDLAGGASAAQRFDYVRPTAGLRFNTGFPHGSNDGAVWAGRGATLVAQGGVAARSGPLSVVLAPVAFVAQNVRFPLAETGAVGNARFLDPSYPLQVDRPQRFGDQLHARLDPGQSTLRIDAAGAALGLSTANQAWGPGDRYAMILGNNAAGFPHAFVGTAAPLNLRLVRLHVRAMWGELAQSAYSPVTGPRDFQSEEFPGRRRFASGLIAVLQPGFLPTLEVGAARFYHSPWRPGGPTRDDFLKPLDALFKQDDDQNTDVPGDPFQDFDNQIGSVFARWVFPQAGFELFGEFYREDHNWDLRDLVNEPDHSGATLVGARKAFRRPSGAIVAVRGEVMNAEVHPVGQWRSEGYVYVHGVLRQGHTHRGQPLGADVGAGVGAGAALGVDYYSERGRRSITWSRTVRGTRSFRTSFGTTPPAGVMDEDAMDVQHAVEAEAVFFRGGVDLTAGIGTVFNFNRNFAGDAINLGGSIAARYNF